MRERVTRRGLILKALISPPRIVFGRKRYSDIP